MVFLKDFSKKVDYEKKAADFKKSMKNLPGGKELTLQNRDIFSFPGFSSLSDETLSHGPVSILPKIIAVGGTLNTNTHTLSA